MVAGPIFAQRVLHVPRVRPVVCWGSYFGGSVTVLASLGIGVMRKMDVTSVGQPTDRRADCRAWEKRAGPPPWWMAGRWRGERVLSSTCLSSAHARRACLPNLSRLVSPRATFSLLRSLTLWSSPVRPKLSLSVSCRLSTRQSRAFRRGLPAGYNGMARPLHQDVLLLRRACPCLRARL